MILDDIQFCTNKNIITNDLGIKSFVIYKFKKVSYLICLQKVHQAIKTIIIKDNQSAYMCGFQKFINLEYLNTLKKLFQLINLQTANFLLNQWFCLYQISSFSNDCLKKYKIQAPSYGREVKIIFKQSHHFSKISNFFSLDEEHFYFLQQPIQRIENQQLGIVVNQQNQQIIGICYKYENNPLICIPLQLIASDLSPPLKIYPLILPILLKTVYLQIDGSYSTGTFISQTRILTVRHLLNIKNPQIGFIIKMKQYPFVKTHSVKLVKLFFDQIDLIQLEFNHESQKLLYHNKQMQSSYYLQQKKEFSSISIGQSIVALGFGKYNYSLSNFSQIDILLPTISTGIISKNIQIKNQKVFFKTDASLYNGFSGCGIWFRDHQIGVAVFIITNTSTKSKLQKQNFSYYMQFVMNRLIKASKTMLTKSQLQLIKNIDNFGVRIQMKILPSL